MEDTTTLITIIDIINAGGVVAILTVVLLGFYSGKILSRKTHDEISEKTDVIVDRLVEKINGSFEKQSTQQTEFIKRVDALASDYFIFQKDIRDGMQTMREMNPKLLDTLQSIDDQLKKQNGD